ncbi:helix-turn-helix domain-containing protein [Streptomyces sp. NPDC087844]|uniref:helix-turn-helix domain-containing protein n=1 Tax=Streptomyces sp. NPDC087844 TaxID=3365805 RepID=UPI0037F71BBB
MRYAQGGGLTAGRGVFRERLRVVAAERFSRGDDTAVVARDLRVTVRPVQRWRRAWAEGGTRALASKGPAREGPLVQLPLQRREQLIAQQRQGPDRHPATGAAPAAAVRAGRSAG